MKLFNPLTHGYFDYFLDCLFILAPTLFGFSDTATSVCYSFAFLHLAMNLCTQYLAGVFPWIPLAVHGGIEVVSAVVLLAMPWMAGYAADDIPGRNFSVGMGFVLSGLWVTTSYRVERDATVLPFSKTDPYEKAM